MKPARAAVLVLGLLVPRLAFGQGILQLPTQGKPSPVPPVSEPTTKTANERESHEHYLALDLFGGVAGNQKLNQSTEDEWPSSWGWDAGVTLNYGLRELGVTAAVGHHSIDGVSTYHFVAGAQITKGWSEERPLRFFMELLAGVALTRGDAPPRSSGEWGFGAGIDFAILRVKFQEVWLEIGGHSTKNLRLFVGGVIPFCFRACEESDLAVNRR